VLRDDIHEARALQEQATGELAVIRQNETFFSRLTEPLIDRQGKNHYIETLYHHYPRSA